MKYPRLSASPLLLSLPLTLLVSACAPDDTGPRDTDPADCVGGKCDVYGTDGRHEVYEFPASSQLRQIARSTAALVRSGDLTENKDGDFDMAPVPSLGAAASLCDGVRFREQPQLGYCSGFLAGDDVFITAGHCLSMNGDPTEADQTCSDTRIVFDFGYQQRPSDPFADLGTMPSANVYSCAKVLHYEFDASGGAVPDLAVIKLDRSVAGRQPLPFRRSGRISEGQEVYMIGHPSGLPTKLSMNGYVKYSGLRPEVAFQFDLEMFGGNSGGPIFNRSTHLVEGVASLYSGVDFIPDDTGTCNIYGQCGDNIDCFVLPGAYPLAQRATEIDQAIAGTTP